MSFEAYLSCFEDSEVGYFPTSIVEDAFTPFISRRDPEFSCWVVTYDDTSSADLYLNLDPDDALRCSGFTVARSPDDPRLFKALCKFCVSPILPFIALENARRWSDALGPYPI